MEDAAPNTLRVASPLLSTAKDVNESALTNQGWLAAPIGCLSKHEKACVPLLESLVEDKNIDQRSQTTYTVDLIRTNEYTSNTAVQAITKEVTGSAAPLTKELPIEATAVNLSADVNRQDGLSFFLQHNGTSATPQSVVSAATLTRISNDSVVSHTSSAAAFAHQVSSVGTSEVSCLPINERKRRKEEKQRRKELKEERRKRRREEKEESILPATDSASADSVPFPFSEHHKESVNKDVTDNPNSATSTVSSGISKRARKGNEELSGHTLGETSFMDPLWNGSMSLPLAADTSRADSNCLLDFGNSMVLKSDHALRPLIVCPTGHLYLEMTHSVSKPAADFLVTIAEPVSRPENVHEFQITVFSLYAAIGVGVTLEDIFRNLDKFSKNKIPPTLEHLLRLHGNSFGRVKIILRDNRYFLEASTREDLEYMLSNPTVAENRIRNSMSTRQVRLRTAAAVNTTKTFLTTSSNTEGKKTDDSIATEAARQALDSSILLGVYSIEAPTLDPSTLSFNLSKTGLEKNRNNLTPNISDKTSTTLSASAESQPSLMKQVYLFEVKADQVGRVKESALTELKRPLLSEYDFRRDHKNPVMDIALKPTTRIRYYQERALRKMFSNGRARSGIIVLPCGAGKTLTGITAATTIRRSAMVLTSSSVAVDQWRRSFTEFTTLDPSLVISLTSDQKRDLPDGAVILISTYTMMAYSGKRSAAAERILNQVRDREWGLLIFDEVQFAPAPAFRKINDIVKSHCKLGLTATLVREDDLIHDLQWLIGPKLYEANWLELQEAGYLAKVQVSEVWCPMTAEFYREYLVSPHAKQRKLWVCNPNKLRVCEYLLRFHESRNDKIIVFSDNLFALKEVAFTLKKPFISGEVGMQERMVILNKFKTSPRLNTIFLSKVGDNAIDIPCANVVIQISFNFASRRQEAQRLGRILRPKPKADEAFNAFFYSLISKDTQEMLYADKRQQFIIDQGYAYKVLPISVFPMKGENLIFDDPQRQKELLARIISTNDQCMDIEDDDVVLNDGGVDSTAVSVGPAEEEAAAAFPSVRTALSKLSGGSSKLLYREKDLRNGRQKSSVTTKNSSQQREIHPFFRSLYKKK